MEAAVQLRWDAVQPAYKQKISTYARQHFSKIPGFDQDDLESELWEVLWIAVQNYHPDHGARFNSYFWEIVRRRYADLIKSAFRKKRQANLFTQTLEQDSIRIAVEQLTAEHSAEAEAMANFSVQERLRVPRKRRNVAEK